MGIKNALIIPDTHIPFQDHRAFALMLDAMEDCYGKQHLDSIVILGDFLDFYDLSFHGKSAKVNVSIRHEITEAHKVFQDICKRFPHTPITYLLGNHEYRFFRYLNSNAPELFHEFPLEEILGVDDYGVELVPYGKRQKHHVLGTSLIARHEPIGGGQSHTLNSLKRGVTDVIYGHTHQYQQSMLWGFDGKPMRAYSCGWLGNKDHEAYNWVKFHEQWCLCFGKVTVDESLWFDVQLIPIIDYKCILDGHMYTG